MRKTNINMRLRHFVMCAFDENPTSKPKVDEKPQFPGMVKFLKNSYRPFFSKRLKLYIN